MKVYFITSKLNFRTAGGSVEEFDLMIRTFMELGSEVTVVTTFSHGNDINVPLPYNVIEENISTKSLLKIQAGGYRLLKKYSKDADLFHVDGHLFIYGAGLYRWLGGKVPVSAYFNREQKSWPEDRSVLFNADKLSTTVKQRLERLKKKEYVYGHWGPPWQDPYLTGWKRTKKSIRWLIERLIGMPIANGIDLRSFISPFYQATYEKFGFKNGQNNIVIGDPLDFRKIMSEGKVDENSYIKRLKKQGPYTLFYSSRMAPGKGFDAVLTGFSKVKNKDDFKLILGGTGPEEAQVHQMVKDLGLEKYVELPGWVDKEQLYAYYRQADIFIQADWRFIGTSYSLLYALAFGVPSILPGGGGLEWNAKGGALYFEYKNWDDLARKIEQLAADHELRAKLSRGCYDRIRDDEINYEVQLKKLYLHMNRLVSANKGKPITDY